MDRPGQQAALIARRYHSWPASPKILELETSPPKNDGTRVGDAWTLLYPLCTGSVISTLLGDGGVGTIEASVLKAESALIFYRRENSLCLTTAGSWMTKTKTSSICTSTMDHELLRYYGENKWPWWGLCGDGDENILLATSDPLKYRK